MRLTPIEAIGVVGSLAGLTVLPLPAALASCAAAAALVSVDERGRRRWMLRAGALALSLGAIVAAVSDDDAGPVVRWQWDRAASDLASATDPVGYFPSRPGLVCTTGTACAAGERPRLNVLMFGNGGFPQGIRDERRFLMARIVPETPLYFTSDLGPMHDPLRVAPGDEIEVSGIVDNAGDRSDPASIARAVRVLLSFPEGAGTTHALLSSVSSPSAAPAAVSDSVLIESKAPTYLRYKPGSAVVLGPQGSVRYHLPDGFLAPYDADRLDRRTLAARGAPVGCSKPDGALPAGRSCAVRFQATFDVRYAASALDVNGIGGITQGFTEVTGVVHGDGYVPLYWAPRRSAMSDLDARSGRDVSIDCILFAGTGIWYHVADAAKLRDGAIYGYDTAFIPARNITHLRNSPNECFA